MGRRIRSWIRNVIIVSAASATCGFGTEECKNLLSSATHVTIVSSGRPVGYEKEFEQAAAELYAPGAIVDQLNLANPIQIHELVPSAQLNVLAALGRHAVPHAQDGVELVRAAQSAGGVLEFVTAGEIPAHQCPVCRAFYSDTTSKIHQISVLHHVTGHNDFASHSMYAATRGSDPIAESLALSDYIAHLYEEHDHDEVARWYQWLLTLKYQQDMVNGTFEDPSKFDPAHAAKAQSERVVHATVNGTAAQNAYAARKHPRSPTPSILQAFVMNLPPTMPEWKKEMARRFERMERILGFYVSTKIMNEGWATLMQELLPPYTKTRTSADSVEIGQLMQGVAFPRLDNPYYTGLQCWRIVRKRFNARPEIKNLPPQEQDRRFIEYAHRDIISWMNDYQFIRYALDDQWVAENKLMLSRKAEKDEERADVPPPQKQNQEQKVILSTDAKRVVAYIARKLADRSLSFPDIWLHEFNGFGRGIVDLRHHIVEGIPLLRQTVAPTLFVMSQMMERPVSLVTNWRSEWGGFDEPEEKQSESDFDVFFKGPPQRKKPKPGRSIPIRVEVEPNGMVRAYKFENETDVQPLPEIAALYQSTVESYVANSEAAINEDLSSRDLEFFRPLLAPAVDSHTLPATQMFSHSPTAGHALLELAGALRRGMTRAMKLAISGTGKLRKTEKGVRVKVIPDIPVFHLDNGIAQQILSSKPPAPVDTQLRMNTFALSTPESAEMRTQVYVGEDDSSVLGQGEGSAGDVFWGDKSGGGQGQGEAPGKEQGGEDAKEDPTEVEIPADLFIKTLLENFELPNFRKKNSAGDPANEDQYEGGIHRPQGRILWERTVPAALNYAIEMRRRKGLPVRGVSQLVLLKEGLKFIQRSDLVVSDRQPVPEPRSKAIVTFVIDLTGSMQGKPQEVAKEWVGFVDWLIRSFYKQVEVRFVGYSENAKEYTREEIFKAFIGSITIDSSGFALAEKIVSDTNRYPDHEWDKYVFGLGDGGSTDEPATTPILDRLYKICSYMGWVHVIENGRGYSDFVDPIVERSQRLPWFGYTEIDSSSGSVLKSVPEFFKGKPKE